jgi:hypothetical protein
MLLKPTNERTLMTLMSWRGTTAVVADGDHLMEVDCERLIAAAAPVDVTACVEQILIARDGCAGGLALRVILNDVGREVMRRGIGEFPYGLVAVFVDGVRLNLEMVQHVADAGPDAELTLYFEQAAEMAEAA